MVTNCLYLWINAHLLAILQDLHFVLLASCLYICVRLPFAWVKCKDLRVYSRVYLYIQIYFFSFYMKGIYEIQLYYILVNEKSEPYSYSFAAFYQHLPDEQCFTWTGEEFVVEQFVCQISFFWAKHGNLGLNIGARSIAALNWKIIYLQFSVFVKGW